MSIQKILGNVVAGKKIQAYGHSVSEARRAIDLNTKRGQVHVTLPSSIKHNEVETKKRSGILNCGGIGDPGGCGGAS